MLVPMSWLKEYVNLEEVTLQDFCDQMIMSGSNIEEVMTFGEQIHNIVIGEVLEVKKHPDADSLYIVKVDIGQTASLQIVTGADNVTEGVFVPVICAGGKLPDGKIIEKTSLRGVESDGMLCSAKELGYEDKVIPVAHKDGIFILEGDLEPGSDFVDATDARQTVVEFEITPNRPDCLCMIGMAREASAVFEKELFVPEPQVQKEEGSVHDYINVQIKRPDMCLRYVARIVKNVQVQQSPWWLQNRLIASGIRPINNIVDITNYVMLEYGTPIHAFDLRMIEGGQIIVDTAKDGEKFTTLDEVERVLDQDSLLIQDEKKGVALAGIMGGLNSEIKEDTATILIEAACFEKDSTRRTSKKIGLRTEASSRYEKGVDPNLCKTAADRVCQLIEMMEAGVVIEGAVDVYPKKVDAITTAISAERINQRLGIHLSEREMEKILRRLAMDTKVKDNLIEVTPPTVRMDLMEEVDYVEEIARIYGYDKLPSTLPRGNNEGLKNGRWLMEDLIRETLLGMGLDEIQTYSFVSPKGVEKIRCEKESGKYDFVKLLNPLGEENSVMRTTLIPNMLEVLERNYTRYLDQVEAFELGRIFIQQEQEDLPLEKKMLTIGIYGSGEDFYAIKGILESLFIKLGIEEVRFMADRNHVTFHPGRCARMEKGKDCFGIIGEVHYSVAEKYNLPERVYIAELDVEVLYQYMSRQILYKPIPKFPAIQRDLALIVKDDMESVEIVQVIIEKGGALLEDVRLFDVYKGKQLPEGHKSMAYSLTYRDPNRTLKDEEINKLHDSIVTALKERLGAILRDI